MAAGNEHISRRTSKRRRGYPSETHVSRRGGRTHLGETFLEKLGRNDPCPCGSGKKFKKCCMHDRDLKWSVGDDYWR